MEPDATTRVQSMENGMGQSPSGRGVRSRAWCFTRNNYNDTNLEDTFECRYICYGKEVAPTTLTPHIQGYVYFSNPKSLGGVRKLLPGAHVTKANGSYLSNKVYCSKDGCFTERGVPPTDNVERGEMEKLRWATAWDLAKTGSIEDIDSEIRFRYYSTIKRIQVDFCPPVESLSYTCGLWIKGTSGTGKSFSVHSSFEPSELYIKPMNEWWCGYKAQPYVLLDDISEYHVKMGDWLKHWSDHYAFTANIKGGSARIRPKLFIVTSQYSIDEIWNSCSRTREALNRRFKVIEKFSGVDLNISLEFFQRL